MTFSLALAAAVCLVMAAGGCFRVDNFVGMEFVL